MKKLMIIATALGASMLGGCAVVATPGYYYYDDGYYYYDTWGYEGRGNGHHGRGGRSEPGNESGWYPARPSDGRGGGGHGGGSSGGGERGWR